MVTVKDTKSFIRASVVIHGTRYDYSLADWSGHSGRITLICRVCGPFEITADSHYRKGCGCRECGLKSRARKKGNYQVCPHCRKWAKYRGASLHCRECAKKVRHQKKVLLINKHTKLCKRCNSKFQSNYPAQIYCSKACGSHKLTLKVDVACYVCKKNIQRFKGRRDRYCCSLKCQRKLLAIFRGRRKRRRLSIIEKKFHTKSMVCGNCRSWRRKLERLSVSKLKKKRDWKMRFASMVHVNFYREMTSVRHKKAVGSRYLPSWETVINRLANTKELCRWSQKLSNLASTQRKRMRNKSAAETYRNSNHSREDAVIIQEKS